MAADPYDPSEFPPFAVSVDLVVLTVRDGRLCTLLITRGISPFEGSLALPGGFVRIDESLADAARRELAEETGIHIKYVHLEQLASYGRRIETRGMRVVSVAYLALIPSLPEPQADTDAATAAWIPADDAAGAELAFDHRQILEDGIERARAKLEYSTLATAFCGPEFTITELRTIYEAVWGVELDPRNFHRKVIATDGFVEQTERTVATTGGRPAQLFRAGTATELHPPLAR